MARLIRRLQRTGSLAIAAWLLGSAPASGQTIQVGAAVTELGVAEGVQLVGVPLAGYGGRRGMPDVLGQYPFAHYFPPGREARANEEIRAKAFVIQRGTERLVFVSLDLVGVDRELRDRIVAALSAVGLGFDEKAVIVSATHTHSGPGALSANHFLEFSATDRLHAGLRDSMVTQIAGVVADAVTDLQAAKLYHFTTDVACDTTTNFQTTTTCPHKNRSREKHHADHRLSLLAAKNTSGEWIGAMVNFAVHGTAYRPDNDQLSADYPGAIERAFAKAIVGAAEAATFPVLFLNGAEGDVTPTFDLDGPDEELEDLATQAWGLWESLPETPVSLDEPWAIEAPEVELGRPFLYLRPELKPLHDTIPFSLLGIELETYFPTKARIWSFALGDIRFLSVPGEPTTDVGLALRKVAAENGYPDAWILGLTNDHLGYFTSPEDWDLAEYESGATAYGAFGARRLVNQHSCLFPDPP